MHTPVVCYVWDSHRSVLPAVSPGAHILCYPDRPVPNPVCCVYVWSWLCLLSTLCSNTLCHAATPALYNHPTPGLFLPASAFKAVRRAAADQLLALQQQHTYADGLAQDTVLPELLSAAAAAAAAPQAADAAAEDPAQQVSAAASSSSSAAAASSSSSADSRSDPQRGVDAAAPEIRVLCRTPEQVSAALAVPWLQEVVLDFLEVHGLKEAVAAVRGAGKQVGGLLCVVFVCLRVHSFCFVRGCMSGGQASRWVVGGLR
jgi:hypothetical protein